MNASNVTDIFRFSELPERIKIVKGNCRHVYTHSWLCYYNYTKLIHSSSERETASLTALSFHPGDQMIKMDNSNFKIKLATALLYNITGLDLLPVSLI